MPALLLRGARVPGHEARLDLLIGEGGRIERLAPRIEAPSGVRTAELAGRLVAPGLVDAHQHLDKTPTLRAVKTPLGTRERAIPEFARFATTMSAADIVPPA